MGVLTGNRSAPLRWLGGLGLGLWIASLAAASAPSTPPSPLPLRFPTPNTALLEPEGGERFFVGTAGKPWTHGTFGCTRTGGWQLHEGIDIRSVERDSRGEPTDPVFATADGIVAYINNRAGLSNYGIYLVLEHELGGMRLWSLYAHLKEVREGLQVGDALQSGERIATMGRTANTRSAISKDRAHLHFEVGFLTHLRFPEWLKKTVRGARNDHGVFNGQNFLGLDPQILLLSSYRFGDNFDLARFLTAQPELFRVAVRSPPTQWMERYPMLVHNPQGLSSEATAGYEIHFDYTGIPVRIYPRTETELPSNQGATLLAVNEEEYARNPCRRLVVRQGGQFRLGANGTRLLDLLTY